MNNYTFVLWNFMVLISEELFKKSIKFLWNDNRKLPIKFACWSFKRLCCLFGRSLWSRKDSIRPSLASMHFKNSILHQEMNQSKVFVNYNKFVPPSHPHVPIDLKIDLTSVNNVEPANSFFDGNFLWRVKWQAKGYSHLSWLIRFDCIGLLP